MTTRAQAETLLFSADGRKAGCQFDKLESNGQIDQSSSGKARLETGGQFDNLESLKGEDGKNSAYGFRKLTKPTRRRLDATYCPHCRGWVEVRLNPVRLHCTVCGLEAKP